MKSFFARHSLMILFVTVFMLPLALQGARKAFETNRNNVQDWLPPDYPETASFQWFRNHFAGEEFVLVSWEGCTVDDQRLKLFVDKLVPADGESRPGNFFQSVITGPKIIETLTKEPINLSPEDAASRLKGSLIGPDLKQTCVVLTLSAAGKEKLKRPVDRIVQVASECNIPRQKLHMGGPAVDNVAIDRAGEQSLFRLAGLAMVIGLVISWWCLRSGRLIAMVFTAGIYSAALSLAIVFWSGVELNAILLSMPSLVYVAAISGAIHLSNYYRDTADEEGLAGAPGRALRHAALPVGLATGTTAIGLLSLFTSELVPIKLFGLYSAIGVVASLLLLCLFLPAAFELWPLKAAEMAAAHAIAEQERNRGQQKSGWWSAAEYVIDHHGWMMAGGVVVLLFCGWGMTKMTTSVQLMRMFPPDAPILKDYQWLEENLGELVPMEVVLKLDQNTCKLNFLERMELVQRIQQRIDLIPEVGSSLSAVTFAPHLPKKEDYRNSGAIRAFIGDPYARARSVFNKRLTAHRDDYLKEDYLAEDGDHELWRISARVGALKDVDYGEFQKNIKAEVESVIGTEAEQVARGESVVYTGLIPLIYKSQRSLLDNLLWGFVMDLVVVTLVMMIAVREWSAGVVLLLPSVFPVFIVFGVMGWLGIVVDTGTVMAPGVALGVTVDDVVHFMLMYRGGLKRGLRRRESLMLAYKGCARAMYQSWGVIGLGLSVFALSPFTPTQRFGYMMVTLLTAALVGNLVVLPAVLASPLGALFGRSLQRRKLSPADEIEIDKPSNGVLHTHLHDGLETEAAHRSVKA